MSGSARAGAEIRRGAFDRGARLLSGLCAVLITWLSAIAAPSHADDGGRRLPQWAKRSADRPSPALPAIAPRPPVPARAALVAATLSEQGDGVALALAIEGSGASDVRPAITVLTDPPRLVIDLGAVVIGAEVLRTASSRPKVRASVSALIEGLRFGIRGAGRAAVVIDLVGPAAVTRAEMALKGEPGTASRALLVLELQPTDAATFKASALPAIPPPLQAQQVAHGRAQRAADRPGGSRPVVVIDAGHGGTDPGAIGANGLMEKSVVLSVARRLEATLTAAGYDVVMTRAADVFVALPRRVEIAQQVEAGVFVSIHADSIANERAADAIRGASVYTLSERASSEAARRLAEKENAAGGAVMGDLATAAVDVRDILVDLTRRETDDLSAELKSTLIGSLRTAIKVARDPSRSAAFYVLRQTRTPAVLVELGYLTNPGDEALMASVDWQQKVARSLADGIEGYFKSRAAPR